MRRCARHLLLPLCLVLFCAAPAPAQTSALVGLLTSRLGVQPAQASGGAGAIFQAAQGNLDTADFGRIAAVVPDMDGLLKAAPAPTGGGSGGSLLGSASALLGKSSGTLGTAAGLADSFGKLGMDGGMVGQFVPVILEFVRSKGGEGVMGLLQGALP